MKLSSANLVTVKSLSQPPISFLHHISHNSHICHNNHMNPIGYCSTHSMALQHSQQRSVDHLVVVQCHVVGTDVLQCLLCLLALQRHASQSVCHTSRCSTCTRSLLKELMSNRAACCLHALCSAPEVSCHPGCPNYTHQPSVSSHLPDHSHCRLEVLRAIREEVVWTLPPATL